MSQWQDGSANVIARATRKIDGDGVLWMLGSEPQNRFRRNLTGVHFWQGLFFQWYHPPAMHVLRGVPPKRYLSVSSYDCRSYNVFKLSVFIVRTFVTTLHAVHSPYVVVVLVAESRVSHLQAAWVFACSFTAKMKVVRLVPCKCSIRAFTDRTATQCTLAILRIVQDCT